MTTASPSAADLELIRAALKLIGTTFQSMNYASRISQSGIDIVDLASRIGSTSTSVSDLMRHADKEIANTCAMPTGFMHMRQKSSAAIADKMLGKAKADVDPLLAEVRKQTALLEVLAKHADRADAEKAHTDEMKFDRMKADNALRYMISKQAFPDIDFSKIDSIISPL